MNSSGIGVCYTVTKELLCTKIYKTWERLVFTMEEIKTVQIGQITLAYKEFGSGDKYGIIGKAAVRLSLLSRIYAWIWKINSYYGQCRT